MSDFHFYDDDTDRGLDFRPETGWIQIRGAGERINMIIGQDEAINLASKLLQWGTS